MGVRIGVTGGFGFLGWHTSARLLSLGAEVRRLGRNDLEHGDAPLEGLDAVCHCAGVNRGDPAAVRAGNLDAAGMLTDKIRRARVRPRRLVYANSTQSLSDSPYGRSKREAGEALAGFCAEEGIEYHDATVPNVFGEGGRPFYNSFVATFCHQLAVGDPCTVVQDSDVVLTHAQQVAAALADAALHGTPIPNPMPGTQATVSGVLSLLEHQLGTYRSGVFPNLDDPFAVDMFNTLRAAVFAAHSPVIHFTTHTDPRGWLVETVKSHGGGQTFVSSTVPGVTRGNHYHLRKIERFAVVQGSATIQMRRLFSDEIQTFHVNGADPVAVEIPTLHTHLITNSGNDPLLTLFWANELFDPEAPDTFGLPVVSGPDR